MSLKTKKLKQTKLIGWIFFRNTHPFDVHPLTVRKVNIMFREDLIYNFSVGYIFMFMRIVNRYDIAGTLEVIVFIVRHFTKIDLKRISVKATFKHKKSY